MVPDVTDDVRFDRVLTLVDAHTFNPDTRMGSEASLSQIMATDTIPMSETDIGNIEKVDRTIKYTKSVRPAATILLYEGG